MTPIEQYAAACERAATLSGQHYDNVILLRTLAKALREGRLCWLNKPFDDGWQARAICSTQTPLDAPLDAPVLVIELPPTDIGAENEPADSQRSR